MMLSRPLRILLWPASKLYGIGVLLRTQLYASGLLKQKRLKATVISVGNLSVGGTGKTPLVIWLAEKLLAQGHRVAILTRGYRGTASSSDEVELMRSRLQNRVVFGVGKDRFAEGQRIESRQAIDVFLLDDGFQHLQLARDLDIVLMDASRTHGRVVTSRWANARAALRAYAPLESSSLPALKMRPVRKKPFNAYRTCQFLPRQLVYWVFAASTVTAPCKPSQTLAAARSLLFAASVIRKHLFAICSGGA